MQPTPENHGPFRTTCKRTVLQHHHLPISPSCFPSAPYASGATDTPCPSYNAKPDTPGMTNTIATARESTKPSALEMEAPPYAASGNASVAAMKNTTTCTSARAVEPLPMEPANAPEHRKLHPQTPYKADTWEHALKWSNLVTLFPSLVHGLRCGFTVGYPVITCTQSP